MARKKTLRDVGDTDLLERFNEAKEELFNLRNDDDWILDAMYIDPSRSRNITAMQIWQTFLALTRMSQIYNIIKVVVKS